MPRSGATSLFIDWIGVGDVEYYYCDGNFYREVFQGNQLVYVTAKPE
jgi:hypothetical protein